MLSFPRPQPATPALSRFSLFRLTVTFALFAIALLAAVPRLCAQEWMTITLAGQAGKNGFANGLRHEARFDSPSGIAIDAAGYIYVTDITLAVIRRIHPSGLVETFAGSPGAYGHADGVGSAARFNSPQALTIDAQGNLIVGDYDSLIRRITPAGVVTTIAGSYGQWDYADGTGTQARFRAPRGLAVDAAGNIYVSDTANRVIRKITPAGVVTTLAGTVNNNYSVTGSGDGVGPAARFGNPVGITVDPSGNLYVVDSGYRSIRRISPQGVVTTIAGVYNGGGIRDGTGAEALFGYPGGIARDPSGDLYVLEPEAQVVRRVTPAGVVTTLLGVAGLSGTADGGDRDVRFNWPGGIAIDAAGQAFIADTRNFTIRKRMQVFAPTGVTVTPGFSTPAGTSATFLSSGTGTPLPTYQWHKDGVLLPGATGQSLTLANVRPQDAGNYTVTYTNIAGAATSAPSRLTIIPSPAFSTAPQNQTVSDGLGFTLSASVQHPLPLQYTWRKDGELVPGATNATLAIPSATPAHAGRYTLTVSSAAGTVVSEPAVVTVLSSRFVNLSVRSSVGGPETALIVGFVVAGNGKPLLVRGNGASLAQYGVSGAMADPQLVLYRGAQPLVANDDWHLSPNFGQILAATQKVGAFAVPNPSRDAALLQTLSAGAHSAHLSAASGAGGICLAELYDADAIGEGRLVNLSARAPVGTGDNTLIAGFVIAGNIKKRVLIRGVGPGLTAFGVTSVLNDPRVAVFQNGVSIIGGNDDWGGDAGVGLAAAQVGAFPLTPGAKDAALLLTLDPGAYTAQVSGVNNATGTALVEVYEVP